MVLRSSSVTSIPSRAQKYAVAQPTIPPPTTMTSMARRYPVGGEGRGAATLPRMYLGIDHLVIAVADPDEAVAAFEDGPSDAAPTGGGRHEALGTFNRIVWLGDSFVEFIGVFDAGLAEGSWVGAPALRALEAGGGFATWAIATDDLDGELASLAPAVRARRAADGRAVAARRGGRPLAAGGTRAARPATSRRS